MKIIAIVKSKDGSEFFVLDEPVKLEYIQLDDSTIVGMAEPFLSFYKKEYDRHAKAFAGREFDLTMIDGTIVHCNGQWWSALTNCAVEEMRLDTDRRKVIQVAASTIDQLRNCYVFVGYSTLVEDWEKFRAKYDGPVYDYYEYEKQIKNR